MRAIVSVSDKSGLAEFARGLCDLGVDVYSTGGTKKGLEAAGIKVHSVSEITGFPEILDGRVKTLHPKIHGGLLARRDSQDHLGELQRQGIEPIDLVVVNLYPFSRTIAQPGVTLDEAIEQIDIGGVTLIRAAAKNYSWVTVVTSPSVYGQLQEEMSRNHNRISLSTRARLAVEAFQHTAQYDSLIASYLEKHLS